MAHFHVRSGAGRNSCLPFHVRAKYRLSIALEENGMDGGFAIAPDQFRAVSSNEPLPPHALHNVFCYRIE
jgi:hypothetical protein